MVLVVRIFELAELIHPVDLSRGGRRRHYPEFMWLVFEALLSVYGSARRVEAELAHPLVSELLRRSVHQRFRCEPSKWLPDTSMRRHRYLYARNRYLTDPAVFAKLAGTHREIAARQAREPGLLNPGGPGSWTHPGLIRMLHADGKVIIPPYAAKADDNQSDRVLCIRQARDLPARSRRKRCSAAALLQVAPTTSGRGEGPLQAAPGDASRDVQGREQLDGG